MRKRNFREFDMIQELEETFKDATKGENPKILYVDYPRRMNNEEGSGLHFFVKKDEARDFARENGNLCMWSIDKFSGRLEQKGAKFFVVADYETFWKAYEICQRPTYGIPGFDMDKEWQTFDAEGTHSDRIFQVLPFAYEVIMEYVPLHLYLDLEGCKKNNPDTDFDALTYELLQELQTFMIHMHIAPRESLLHPDHVILDSSTKVKFSKHIIYKIPDCVFGNNYLCGALMRNFHLHLISKYGSPDLNKFYINPFEEAKVKIKVCMLDFAVYTKFRDFRLVGSCKRRGSYNAKTFLRWLWHPNAPNQVTKEHFLDSLIQNINPNKITYTIHAIYDTINDGFASSSSLRTPQPINGYSHGAYTTPILTSNHSIQSHHQRFRLKLTAGSRYFLEQFGGKVAEFLQSTSQEPFCSFFQKQGARVIEVKFKQLKDGNFAWIISTNSNYCFIKKEKLRIAEHKRGGRTATFLVWATGLLAHNGYDPRKVGAIKQICIANSCTDGIGPIKPSYSSYLGRGLPQHLRDIICNRIKQEIQAQMEVYVDQQEDKQQEDCLFE